MTRNCSGAFCLAILIALSGCKNSTGPAASSSPTPLEVSSSNQVVKAFGHFIPSASSPASIELQITPGFHINANPATFPYLIATEVQPGKVDGITVSNTLTYPPPKMQTFAFAAQPLAVYEGNVTIPISLTPAAGAKGQRTIPFKIRVQACDNEKCYPPATLDAALTIDVGSLKP